LIALVRSLLYAAIFYPATLLWVVVGAPVSLFGRGAMLAIVLSWVEMHHMLVRHVLGIRLRVEGEVPRGPVLIAVKHQSMLETLEMVRLTNLPVIVMKKELADIPLFGFLTRRYGVIPVERSAGARALRSLVEEGRGAIAAGRPVIIYPEGTRVPVGKAPPLKSGFAALYRALGLPVVPVALDSGRLWGRGFVHRSGTVTIRFGETIAAGLPRKEIEAKVHAAINVLEFLSASEAGGEGNHAQHGGEVSDSPP
jgi:1-acyl-sn-glycerol-3-phosphate acyltransferase